MASYRAISLSGLVGAVLQPDLTPTVTRTKLDLFHADGSAFQCGRYTRMGDQNVDVDTISTSEHSTLAETNETLRHTSPHYALRPRSCSRSPRVHCAPRGFLLDRTDHFSLSGVIAREFFLLKKTPATTARDNGSRNPQTTTVTKNELHRSLTPC